MPEQKTTVIRIDPLWIFFVAIIPCLAVFAYQCHVANQAKAKAAAVKGNMRTFQIAMESYATDSGGSYPIHMTDALPYFPGGENSIGGKPGKMPVDPPLIDLGPMSEDDFHAWLQTNASTHFAPLQTIFVSRGGGNSFALMGTDATGALVGGIGGKPMVLSNQ